MPLSVIAVNNNNNNNNDKKQETRTKTATGHVSFGIGERKEEKQKGSIDNQLEK